MLTNKSYCVFFILFYLNLVIHIDSTFRDMYSYDTDDDNNNEDNIDFVEVNKNSSKLDSDNQKYLIATETSSEKSITQFELENRTVILSHTDPYCLETNDELFDYENFRFWGNFTGFTSNLLSQSNSYANGTDLCKQCNCYKNENYQKLFVDCALNEFNDLQINGDEKMLLYIDHKNISLSSNSFQNPNIIDLSLRFNQYYSIENRPFLHLGNIESIDLSFNHITYIRYNTFHHMNKLNYLNLRQNILTKCDDIVQELPSLRILDVSDNKIKRLNHKFLLNCPNIEYLYINDNPLNEIVHTSIFDMKKLKYLDLSKTNIIKFDFMLMNDKQLPSKELFILMHEHNSEFPVLRGDVLFGFTHIKKFSYSNKFSPLQCVCENVEKLCHKEMFKLNSHCFPRNYKPKIQHNQLIYKRRNRVKTTTKIATAVKIPTATLQNSNISALNNNVESQKKKPKTQPNVTETENDHKKSNYYSTTTIPNIPLSSSTTKNEKRRSEFHLLRTTDTYMRLSTTNPSVAPTLPQTIPKHTLPLSAAHPNFTNQVFATTEQNLFGTTNVFLSSFTNTIYPTKPSMQSQTSASTKKSSKTNSSIKLSLSTTNSSLTLPLSESNSNITSTVQNLFEQSNVHSSTLPSTAIKNLNVSQNLNWQSTTISTTNKPIEVFSTKFRSTTITNKPIGIFSTQLRSQLLTTTATTTNPNILFEPTTKPTKKISVTKKTTKKASITEKTTKASIMEKTTKVSMTEKTTKTSTTEKTTKTTKKASATDKTTKKASATEKTTKKASATEKTTEATHTTDIPISFTSLHNLPTLSKTTTEKNTYLSTKKITPATTSHTPVSVTFLDNLLYKTTVANMNLYSSTVSNNIYYPSTELNPQSTSLRNLIKLTKSPMNSIIINSTVPSIFSVADSTKKTNSHLNAIPFVPMLRDIDFNDKTSLTFTSNKSMNKTHNITRSEKERNNAQSKLFNESVIIAVNQSEADIGKINRILIQKLKFIKHKQSPEKIIHNYILPQIVSYLTHYKKFNETSSIENKHEFNQNISSEILSLMELSLNYVRDFSKVPQLIDALINKNIEYPTQNLITQIETIIFPKITTHFVKSQLYSSIMDGINRNLLNYNRTNEHLIDMLKGMITQRVIITSLLEHIGNVSKEIENVSKEIGNVSKEIGNISEKNAKDTNEHNLKFSFGILLISTISSAIFYILIMKYIKRRNIKQNKRKYNVRYNNIDDSNL